MILFIISVWLFSEYIKAVTNINGISIIIPILLFILSFLSIRKIKNNDVKTIFLSIIFILLVTIISVLNFSSFFNFYGVFFEVVKLFSFLALIFLPYFFPKEKDKYFLNIILYFLYVNIIVLSLQLIVSVDIVKYIGMTHGMDTQFLRDSRPTGLTNSSNTIGGVSVFFLLLSIYLYKIKNNLYFDNKKLAKMIILSIICIILSTSKQSFFCMLIIISMFNGINFKRIIFGFFIGFSLIFAFLYYNTFNVMDKVEQYIYLFSNIGNGLNLIFVENRGVHLYNALSIFSNNIIGLGFGTWGDYSSTFNLNNTMILGYNKMSDGYMSHLIVEQGIFIFLYFYILYCFIPSNKYRMILLVVTLIMFFPSMGFSVPVFTTGFCLVVYFMSRYN